MKVGFIGLGNMGKTMAKRLLAERVELSVWNRTQEKAADLGVEVVENPAALISKSEVVVLNLFDSDAVKFVMTGPKGLLEGDCHGKIVIDTTTNHFDSVTHFHDFLKGQGGWYLEAPVLGSILPAAQGALTILVSGEKGAYDKALPLIEKMGKHIFFLERQGLATKMKLINNLVLGSFMATIAEAVAFAEAAGVSRDAVLDIFSVGAANSAVFNAKREKLLKEDFSAHFSSALIYKDLHYLQDLARSLRRPLLTGSVVKEAFAMTLHKGIEDLDFSGIYRVFKDL